MKKLVSLELKEICGGVRCTCHKPPVVTRVWNIGAVTWHRDYTPIMNSGNSHDESKPGDVMWTGDFQNSSACQAKCCNDIGANQYRYGEQVLKTC